MITLKLEDGTIEKMSWKELGARLWPFGKWCIVWNHVIDGKHNGPKTVKKVDAINSYIIHQSIGKSAMNVVGIKKIGGLFNGTEFKPRTKKEKTIRV